MDVDAGEAHAGARGVEILPGELAERPAVDGEGRRGRELLHIKIQYPVAHLLVGREAYRERPVRHKTQFVEQGHNLGDAGLVVRAEESRAGGGYERLPAQAGEVREVRNAQRPPLAEGDVSPVVIGYDARAHARTGEVRRGVHMRDEAEGLRALETGRGGERRIDITLVGQMRVFEAEPKELFDQNTCKYRLSRGARCGVRALGARRVIGYIIKKTFICPHVAPHSESISSRPQRSSSARGARTQTPLFSKAARSFAATAPRASAPAERSSFRSARSVSGVKPRK